MERVPTVLTVRDDRHRGFRCLLRAYYWRECTEPLEASAWIPIDPHSGMTIAVYTSAKEDSSRGEQHFLKVTDVTVELPDGNIVVDVSTDGYSMSELATVFQALIDDESAEGPVTSNVHDLRPLA